MKKILISVLTYIVIMLLSNVTYATTGTVNTETARMRSEPSAEASIVELVSMSEKVEVVEETGDWYKVQYNGKTGYVSKSLLDVTGEVTSTADTTEETANTTPEETTTEPDPQETTATPQEATPEDVAKESEIELTESYVGKLSSEVTIKILPSINSTNIAKIEANTQITIIEILNDWCYIQTDSYLGWARVEIVKNAIATPATPEEETPTEPEVATTEQPQAQPESKKGYVNVESVNVRKEKSTSSEVVDSITKNTEVTILGEEENWYKVEVNGTTGYIATKYISNEKTPETTSRAADTARAIQEAKTPETPQTTTPTSNSGSKGADVVSYAKQYLGTKYVSGGSTPSLGFDCSGFTSYVYKNFGVSLSRSSGGQASNGTSVAKANLQAGDLLIFNNGSNTAVGHVGIYIGNNQFIHAANGSKGVVTTSLSNSYYVTRYVDARRVL